MSLLLDSKFGQGGIVAMPCPPPSGAQFTSEPWEIGMGVVIQKDRRIVVAGHSGGLLVPSDFVLARYLNNGAFDSKTFGTSGCIRTNFGAGPTIPDDGSDDFGNALVLQPDGRIIVAGRSSAGNAYWQFALARYLPNGSLDHTFGKRGITVTSLGKPLEISTANAVALQPDGKIIAAGLYFPPGSNVRQFALVRYDHRGNVDPTFGKNGWVLTEFLPGHDAFANAVAIQANGRIVAAGVASIGGTQHIALAGYKSANGSLDAGFGSNGRVLTPLGQGASGNAIAIDPNGRLVVAGFASIGNVPRMAVVRYRPNGRLDPKFGPAKNGKAYTKGFCQANAVVVLQDGSIILGGQLNPVAGQVPYHFAMVAFDKSGNLNLELTPNGPMLTQIGHYSSIKSMALQADQKKVLTAGFADFGSGPSINPLVANGIVFTLARYSILV